jgi:hypothetical protein
MKNFDGNAMLMPVVHGGVVGGMVGGLPESVTGAVSGMAGGVAAPGQIAGVVADETGSPLPGATVSAVRDGQVIAMAITEGNGQYTLNGVPPGSVTVTAHLEGFRQSRANVATDARTGRRLDFRLPLGKVTEEVTVDSPREDELHARKRSEVQAQAPSQNVFNLQRRVTGVLPVRIEVPRAGSAYRFARPLVLDETTEVSFEYRAR